jgi:curved DNA-binding protein CbpA
MFTYRTRVASAYEILGLEPGASDADIRAAYISLVKAYHPDSGVKRANAEDKLKRVNVAYRVLRNAKLRQLYDERLRRQHESRVLLPGRQRGKRKWALGVGFGLTALAGALVWIAIPRPHPPAEEASLAPADTGFLDTMLQRMGPGKGNPLSRDRLSGVTQTSAAPAILPQEPELPAASDGFTPAPGSAPGKSIERGLSHPPSGEPRRTPRSPAPVALAKGSARELASLRTLKPEPRLSSSPPASPSEGPAVAAPAPSSLNAGDVLVGGF